MLLLLLLLLLLFVCSSVHRLLPFFILLPVRVLVLVLILVWLFGCRSCCCCFRCLGPVSCAHWNQLCLFINAASAYTLYCRFNSKLIAIAALPCHCHIQLKAQINLLQSALLVPKQSNTRTHAHDHTHTHSGRHRHLGI